MKNKEYKLCQSEKLKEVKDINLESRARYILPKNKHKSKLELFTQVVIRKRNINQNRNSMETELGEIKGFKTENIKFEYTKTIGYFEYEPCNMRISVYSKIGLFKRIMIRYFFGLKYVKL